MNKLIKTIGCILLTISLIICNFQGSEISLAYESTANLSVTGKELYDEAYKILDIVNKERNKEGLPSLAMNKTLMEGAMKRSSELSIFYSHTRPNSTSCFTIEELSQLGYHSAGENIAAGYADASSVMNGWMNSEGHRKNILNTRYNSIGIGVFEHNGLIYFTQLFVDTASKTPTKPSNKTVTRKISTSSSVMNLSINSESLSLKDKEVGKLYLINKNRGWSYSSAKLSNDDITWSSSNTNVAKVSSEGEVSVVGSGEATIKATLSNGISTSCKVTTIKSEQEQPSKPEEPSEIELPGKVANIHIDSQTSTKIKVDWNNVSNATKYAVYRATSKTGKYTRIANVTNSYYTDIDKNLKSGTTYYYKVRAYKTLDGKNYYGSYSDIITTTTSPSKVANIHTDSKRKTSIKVDWNNVSKATGYAVYRSTSKNGTYKRVATVESSCYNDKNLTKGKKYYYKVRAYKTLGGKNYYGSYSSILSTSTSK